MENKKDKNMDNCFVLYSCKYFILDKKYEKCAWLVGEKFCGMKKENIFNVKNCRKKKTKTNP
jgi:hypothetical protein